jgi:4-hydroxy-3-methylbut-2-en-1-yl diphosphate reductase
MGKGALTIVLASPRGVSAGVDRAILIVEAAIEKYGAPVYVRHEIVHNRFVVDSLKAKGAVFVDELTEVPDGAPVVFSAHGVPKSVPEAAESRQLPYLDATCPLVTKVHREAEHHHQAGRQIVMIGHKGHPEVIGTMGQVPDGAVLLVENVEDAEAVMPVDSEKVAYITQTTLSVDDTAAITAVLKRRFPNLAGPSKNDICYATTNRQNAVKTIAAHCDAVMVIGAPNSSNSKRLVEVAARSGCAHSILVQRAADIEWETLAGIRRLGITAGASAPEVIVEEIMDAFAQRYELHVETVSAAEENEFFPLPRSLRPEAAA